jgi:hypothetical protein
VGRQLSQSAVVKNLQFVDLAQGHLVLIATLALSSAKSSPSGDDAGDKSDVKVSNIRKVHDIVFTEEGATTFFFSGVVRNSGVLNGLAGNKPIITSPAEVCAKFHN